MIVNEPQTVLNETEQKQKKLYKIEFWFH